MNIKEELKVVGELKGVCFGARSMGNAPKHNTPITPKENFVRFMKGEDYMWTPCSDDFVTVIPREIPDTVARDFAFDLDIPEEIIHAGGKDMFGIEWEYVVSAGGSMVRPGNPLLINDITEWEKEVTFPDIDSWDWEAAEKRLAPVTGDDRVVVTWFFNGLFERLISMMEFENAALAFVDEDEQEGVHRLFDKLCDLYDAIFDKMKKHLNTDVIYFHDDWGSQRAPFFSKAVCDEMLVPYLKRICESAHKRGMYIDFHSCGQVELLVPCMIEAGCDIWSGQPMNDRLMLLEKYGDKIKLNLSPNAPMVFPKTPEEAEAAAKAYDAALDEFMSTYGRFMTSIVVSAMQAGNPKLYERVYTETREAFAK